MPGDHIRKIAGIDRGNAFKIPCSLAWTKHQPCPDLLTDALCEVGAGSIIYGHSENAGDSTAQEGGDPMSTIWAPEQDRVAFGDFPCGEFPGKLVGDFRYSSVGPPRTPVSTWKHIGSLSAPVPKVVKIIQEACLHTLFSSTIPESLP